MERWSHARRLERLERVRGRESRTVSIGERVIRVGGLDPTLAGWVDTRWGAFAGGVDEARGADRTVTVYDAGREAWLPPPSRGVAYELNPLGAEAGPGVVSYHFAVAAEDAEGWRVGLTENDAEPLDRALDNVLRFVAAHLAIDDGGFALHAAGVLCDGEAHLLTGPSRAGKSTASALVEGAESLGDDFGIAIRPGEDWLCPAVPFDNSERVDGRPSRGQWPLAGIWILHQADTTRVEPVASVRSAVASLAAQAAFPWTMPERAGELLDHVHRFVRERRFGHLHFDVEGDIRSALGQAR